MEQWMEEEIIVRQEDGMLTPALEEASQPFVGRWHRLVSQTNWEKGRIIFQWRRALQETGAPASAYSDEAWSRLVGGVSPQHVGRLRRVYERFGQAVEQYPGLYWSHFMAALDWPDAEMWLEGAVQNRWSVARMQSQRSQTLGVAGSPRTASAEIELDEDADSSSEAAPTAIVPEMEEVRTPGEGSAKGEGSRKSELSEEGAPFDEWEGEDEESPGEAEPVAAAASAPAAFAELPPMPDDVAEAFEAFKLAIVRHKLTGWKEISCRQIVKVLDALKRFALASDGAPPIEP
ncbi:MAG TPA: hypothetical protein PK777_03250 [Thermoguttaceae bacterium]|nr:hypothetical protein [Thermoguttaceae bacterium]